MQTASRECSDCHVVHTNERFVTVTLPPDTLHPGETITLQLSLRGKASDMGCHYGHDRIDADFQASFMSTSYSPTVNFADEAGRNWFGTDAENGVANIEKKLTATVPAGADTKYE